MRGIFFLILFAIGGVVGAQFPGFTAQYEQRLDGAIDELSTIIARFDRDASEQNLTRDDALAIYDQADDQFLVSQGGSIRQIFVRYDTLTAHQAALKSASPAEQAISFAQYFDPELAQATWAQYDLSVPLNLEGGIFAFLGGAVAWLTGLGAWAVARLPFRRRNRLRTEI